MACQCVRTFMWQASTRCVQSVRICLRGSVPGPWAGWNLCLLWVTLCTRSVLAAGNTENRNPVVGGWSSENPRPGTVRALLTDLLPLPGTTVGNSAACCLYLGTSHGKPPCSKDGRDLPWETAL